jgi:hypothetical protein
MQPTPEARFLDVAPAPGAEIRTATAKPSRWFRRPENDDVGNGQFAAHRLRARTQVDGRAVLTGEIDLHIDDVFVQFPDPNRFEQCRRVLRRR